MFHTLPAAAYRCWDNNLYAWFANSNEAYERLATPRLNLRNTGTSESKSPISYSTSPFDLTRDLSYSVVGMHDAASRTPATRVGATKE